MPCVELSLSGHYAHKMRAAYESVSPVIPEREFQDGVPGSLRTLRQRAIRDRRSLQSQRPPLGSHFKKVPRHGARYVVARLSAGIETHAKAVVGFFSS